jgi:hypothetical protein
MENLVRANAIPLIGGAYERGIAQADQADRSDVVNAIDLRLTQNDAAFANPVVREYLNKQWKFAQQHCHEELTEMIGIADGFGIDPSRLFDFLHMGIVKNLNIDIISEDGCSTWAVSNLPEGPSVGKNRDFMGEHAGLQAVFAHQDPDWKNDRKMLCVGSFGAPGAYSSGINSDGLVVVDTQIATTDYGVGWLRYFLMTRLLTHHNDVASALRFIKTAKHAGGGSITLADPSGCVAAVDLGHTTLSIVERHNGWVARSNHFEAGSVPNLSDGAPMQGSTAGRYSTLVSALSAPDKTLDSLTNLMASHTSDVAEGLCRHGEDGDSRTLSSAMFMCDRRKLYFTDRTPCDTTWKEYSVF